MTNPTEAGVTIAINPTGQEVAAEAFVRATEALRRTQALHDALQELFREMKAYDARLLKWFKELMGAINERDDGDNWKRP